MTSAFEFKPRFSVCVGQAPRHANATEAARCGEAFTPAAASASAALSLRAGLHFVGRAGHCYEQ
ncbi:MAG: hypothetical protein ABJB12_11340, partial [Pseudomonadota bacterium]